MTLVYELEDLVVKPIVYLLGQGFRKFLYDKRADIQTLPRNNRASTVFMRVVDNDLTRGPRPYTERCMMHVIAIKSGIHGNEFMSDAICVDTNKHWCGMHCTSGTLPRC